MAIFQINAKLRFAATTETTQKIVVGFRPKAVIAIVLDRSMEANDLTSSNAIGSWGIATRADGQRCASFFQRRFAGSDALETARAYDNSLINLLDRDAETMQRARLASMDVDGFTVKWTHASPTLRTVVAYIAIGGEMVQARLLEWEVYGNGFNAIRGDDIDFVPDHVMHLTAGLPSLEHSTGDAMFALGQDNGTEQMSIGTVAEDLSDPNNVSSWVSLSDSLLMYDATQTKVLQVQPEGMEMGGFDIDILENLLDAEGTKVASLLLGGVKTAIVRANKPDSATLEAPDDKTYSGFGFSPLAILGVWNSLINDTNLAGPGGRLVVSGHRLEIAAFDHNTQVSGWSGIRDGVDAVPESVLDLAAIKASDPASLSTGAKAVFQEWTADGVRVRYRLNDSDEHSLWLTGMGPKYTAPNAPIVRQESLASFPAGIDHDFNWRFDDPDDNDTQSAYQLQIQRTSDAVTILDTGKVVSKSRSYTLDADTLVNLTQYQWRVRTWDETDLVGPYSAFDIFTPNSVPTATITKPDPAEVIGERQSAIRWNYNDDEGQKQSAYRIELTDDTTSTVVLDTGKVLGDRNSYTIEDLANAHDYTVRVRVWNKSDQESEWDAHAFTVDYVAPMLPQVTVKSNNKRGRIEVKIFVPPTDVDVPNTRRVVLFKDEKRVKVWERNGKTSLSLDGSAFTSVWTSDQSQFTLINSLLTDDEDLTITTTESGEGWAISSNAETDNYVSDVLDIIAQIEPMDWVPTDGRRTIISKWNPDDTAASWRLSFNNEGRLSLTLSEDGVTARSATSTRHVGPEMYEDTNGVLYVRVRWWPHTKVVQFFTSQDGVVWERFGLNRLLFVEKIWEGDAPVVIGGTPDGTSNFIGDIHYIAVLKGYGYVPHAENKYGPFVNLINIDFGDYTPGTESFEDEFGVTWRMRSNAVILTEGSGFGADGHLFVFHDHSVRDRHTYRYKVRTVSVQETERVTRWIPGRVNIQGVWLFSVENPLNTFVRLDTVVARSYSDSHEHEFMDVEGRRAPLVEWGEHEKRSVQFDSAMLDRLGMLGPLKQLFSRNDILCYRDGRGRLIYGVITDWNATDEFWGEQVPLELKEVDFDPEKYYYDYHARLSRPEKPHHPNRKDEWELSDMGDGALRRPSKHHEIRVAAPMLTRGEYDEEEGPPTSDEEVLADATAAWLASDFEDGVLPDVTGNGHDMTAGGTAITLELDEDDVSSLALDGGGYLETPDHADFELGVGDSATIVAVVRYTGAPGNVSQRLFSKHAALNMLELILHRGATGQPAINLGDGADTVDHVSVAAGAADELLVVAGRLNRAGALVDVDADGTWSAPASGAALGAVAVNASNVRLGMGSGGGGGFVGEIVGVAFYRSALTNDEVAQVGVALGG